MPAYNPMFGGAPVMAAPQLVPDTSEIPGHPLAQRDAAPNERAAAQAAAAIVVVAILVLVAAHLLGIRGGVAVNANIGRG